MNSIAESKLFSDVHTLSNLLTSITLDLSAIIESMQSQQVHCVSQNENKHRHKQMRARHKQMRAILFTGIISDIEDLKKNNAYCNSGLSTSNLVSILMQAMLLKS